MAEDAVQLLDYLGRSAAHVVGFGMGGSIGQSLVIDHPERCLSLTAIDNTSGNDAAGTPDWKAVEAIENIVLTNDRAEIIQRIIRANNVLGGPRFRSEKVGIARLAEAAYDRAYSREATLRQYAAVLFGPDRRPKLQSVRARVLVISGSKDPLYRASDGEDIVNNVPHGRFVPIDGLGHDLPEPVIPELVRLITDHIFATP